MKNLAAAILAAGLLVAACGGSQDQTTTVVEEIDTGAALSALFEEHFQRGLELNPMGATYIGDYRYNDRLAHSYGPEYRATDQAMDEEFLARLLKIDREQLGYQDQLSLTCSRSIVNSRLRAISFPFICSRSINFVRSPILSCNGVVVQARIHSRRLRTMRIF